MNEGKHITILYNRVKSSPETRNLPEVNYSRSDLSDWLYSNGYKVMFRKWKRSSFITSSAPSLDRLDTTEGYDLDNLELVTWSENQRRAYSDRIAGIGRMADGNEEVTQLTMTYEYVDTYVSVSDAARKTGINRGNISSATVKNKVGNAGGYRWVKTKYYKESMESDSNMY